MANHLIDERERALLAPYALFSCDSAGRVHDEPPHRYRGLYQRDRDRILHAAAFRRLSGKMQVFTGDMGDYHRTRLTHTMEVGSVARTIGRALRLNEDLIEALALLHDIGHPPFGHAGEDALHECLVNEGGFSHNQFAIIIATEIENPYAAFSGLNLTHEVLSSQFTRIDKQDPNSAPILEAQVVDLSDSITYDAHDVDDAVKLNLLTIDDLCHNPFVHKCHEFVVKKHGPLDEERLRRALVHEMIDCQVSNLLSTTQSLLARSDFQSSAEARESGFRIRLSDDFAEEKSKLEKFLYEHVYRHKDLIQVRSGAKKCLDEMFHYFVQRPERLPEPYQLRAAQIGTTKGVRDYIAGMTDNFCLETYRSEFGKLPSSMNLDDPD